MEAEKSVGESVTPERITGQFYRRFRKEREKFISSIQGIDDAQERERYGVLMLNRLLFTYFLQQKGFLDGDPYYLTHQLQQARTLGEDRFYRLFLLPLFHMGFGTPAHQRATPLGTIPYLGATLFAPHPEELRPGVHIADDSFSALFTFFDTYHWRLDEAPPASEQELSPTVLGYIFEQQINQQQMGAYYTRADVTDYIARYTLIPALFERLTSALPTACDPFWQLTQRFPHRYIYATLLRAERLPGETEAEQRERQRRATDLLNALRDGLVNTIDDFVTCNLDIERFARDVIIEAPRPLIEGIYQELCSMTVLDPTCGSGAFLLAALRVLAPLYRACLYRLQGQKPDEYNILKEIITRNLYGVDMMPEAIEICRLHLYLKLLAHVRRVEDIEPLPEIAQHVHVGNALVGYTWNDALDDTASPDLQLAREYGIDPHDWPRFVAWKASHQPFHWAHVFPEVAAQGGFTAIIGNPPYVEYEQKKFPYQLRGYQTLTCANLYPCISERSAQLLAPYGRCGMILPLAAFATRNMTPFLEGFKRWFPVSWLSFYHFRPSMLFSGGKIASIPTAIYLARVRGTETRYSTRLMKWTTEQRPYLFTLLHYCRITASEDPENRHYYPKFGHACENTIMEKILQQRKIEHYIKRRSRQTRENSMYYRSAGGLYWKVFVNFPWPYHTTSNKQCDFLPEYDRNIFVALFNSSLFWWYYTVTFDTFNLKDYMLFGFRFTYPDNEGMLQELRQLCAELMENYQDHARHLRRGTTGSYTIYARKAKAIIDRIDAVLARHYGFNDEELTFLRNYDIRYRMRSESISSDPS
jgi:hypothetical protein